MFEMIFLHKPLTAGIAKTRKEHPRICKKHSKALNTLAPQKPILARRAAVAAKQRSEDNPHASGAYNALVYRETHN